MSLHGKGRSVYIFSDFYSVENMVTYFSLILNWSAWFWCLTWCDIIALICDLTRVSRPLLEQVFINVYAELCQLSIRAYADVTNSFECYDNVKHYLMFEPYSTHTSSFAKSLVLTFLYLNMYMTRMQMCVCVCASVLSVENRVLLLPSAVWHSTAESAICLSPAPSLSLSLSSFSSPHSSLSSLSFPTSHWSQGWRAH